MKKSSKPFIVNDLIVLFFNQLGLGHTAMKKLSSLFGWEGLHLKTFQDKEKHIISKIIDNTNDVLSASVTKVKEAYSALDPLYPQTHSVLLLALMGLGIRGDIPLCMVLLL